MSRDQAVGETLSVTSVREGLQVICHHLIARAGDLNTLDAATGDGDTGISVEIGAKAILDELSATPAEDTSELFKRCGMAFNRAAGSTIGALVASAGLGAAREVEGHDELDLTALATVVTGASEAICARGKAQAGDKTLLDALIPASDALQEAAAEGVTMAEGGRRALAAARAGMERTRDMQSRAGRGRWVGERTLGQIDAGAAVVVIAIEAVVGGSD